MTTGRETVLDEIARYLAAISRPHPTRVAVDGVTAAGKSTFAGELVDAVRRLGRPGLHLSTDDYHHLAARRHRDADRARGYYRDAYDLAAFRTGVLDPLGDRANPRFRARAHDLETDQLLDEPFDLALPDTIVVVDGSFLQVAELDSAWDEIVWLDTSMPVAAERAAVRDLGLFGSAEAVRAAFRTRYHAAGLLYAAELDPAAHAGVLVGNDDLTRPVVYRLGHARPDACSRSVAANAPNRPRAIVAGMSTERDYVIEHRDGLLADLDQWLRIPGISAQPERHDDVRRSAQWFADAARRAGFPTVEILDDGPWLPAVYAEWRSADAEAPVVLVYAHHDVQPVDPLELWHTDPFDPTIDGELLRARGASDDKGQLLFHLLGLRAHLAATGRDTPAVTLKFIVEGEEESGSPHFEALLERHRDRLACDVVVVTDTGMVAPDVPSTVTGMRGMVAATVTVHGPDLDLHSGVFGGAVPNPATEIARLVAALHDEHGRVQVPGFYDDVLELTDDERALFRKVPSDDSEFLTVAQSRVLHGEAGFSTLERLGARPTAEVNGIGGGYQGAGHKTIVPSDAFAKLSFRLVADQDPAKIIKGVEQFVSEHTPDGITARLDWEGAGVRACLVPLGTPAYLALTEAIAKAFDGAEVLPTREGGSGPEAGLQQAVGAPLVFLGVGLPDDQIHAPNEKVTLPMLYKGAEAAAYLWSGLAAVGRDALREVER